MKSNGDERWCATGAACRGRGQRDCANRLLREPRVVVMWCSSSSFYGFGPVEWSDIHDEEESLTFEALSRKISELALLKSLDISPPLLLLMRRKHDEVKDTSKASHARIASI